MAKFNFIKTSIEGLLIIEPAIFPDERGYFCETYNKDEFFAAGICTEFVQDNQSCSKKGVLRGLHFQKENPQGKLVRVIKGEVLDVAVDLREESPTFGKWECALLSSENHRQFYLPEGFAHGFLVLSDVAEFVYKCTRLYAPKDQWGIMYNDKELAIDWEKYFSGEVILSEKDKHNMLFSDYKKLLEEEK